MSIHLYAYYIEGLEIDLLVSKDLLCHYMQTTIILYQLDGMCKFNFIIVLIKYCVNFK